jgi:hypothetical protein
MLTFVGFSFVPEAFTIKMNGWIKLYRKFKEWEWYNDSHMVHLFIHLLLSANKESNNWHGITIDRGQLITGLNSLSSQTGISIRSLRTCLERLKSTGELTIKTTNKFSIISILNYDAYQDNFLNSDKLNDKQADKQTTNKRQTNDNKQEEEEYKKIKKIRNNKEKVEKTFSQETLNLYDSIIIFFDEDLRPSGAQKDKWLDTIDKLLRIDNISADKIISIIKRARMDAFWRQNFLSIQKLRQKNKEGICYFKVFEKKFNGNQTFGIPDKIRTYEPNQTF